MNNINDRVALVIGGSRGIGAAVAQRLAEDGADVVLTYQQAADQAAAVVEKIEGTGRRALAIQADCADVTALTDAVDQAAAAFGRLDILVNNAGAFIVAPLEELDSAAVEQTLAVNIRAPFVAAQAAARHMTEGGRIISIGSNVSERTPFPGFALYSMSKSALTGLTKGLARDLGPRGITANLVNPGPTDTDANPADPAVNPGADTFRGFTALGRYAQPGDIAAVVAFLAGDDSRYVTGASINADGGFAV
ncbi:SDR family NAD(P)-dependent oxidoreductase [Goodfellowiella coeruleoviolacea]|uniref:3-oxoacyl-[acyl-carrier protein] reductase n=1 Tax=Goodfellowiella coeruleoviolacea TaxID=334858 RepID=A0AAE3KNI9_9PSEU|nr:SDR family oxidoreductase [Goodfellowiella coeruleoviolacea]MCP2168698.1 3-oxoacyl-[acyl-carrier protein] reductase [Goodfellowiella coeruleoviolacea]